MSRPTSRHVAYGGVAVIVLVLLIISIIHTIGARSRQQPVPTADPPSAFISAPATTSSAPSIESSSPSSPSSPALPVTPSQTGPTLDMQVKAFVEAYYFILPDDSPASRLNRVARLHLTSPEVNQMLDYAIDAQQVQYQQYGMSQRAEVDPHTVTATRLRNTTDSFMVSVPITLIWLKNGQSVARDVIYSVSTWKFQQGNWLLTDYSGEGGG